jgi:hypothetical protein
MKCQGQIGNLCRATTLETLVDRPRVTTNFGDQLENVYVLTWLTLVFKSAADFGESAAEIVG